MNTNKKIMLVLPLMLLLLAGCKKYLDEKPKKSLVVIATAEDCQALLDFNNVMNFRDPASGEISADDYYLRQEDWNMLYLESERRMYTWEKDKLFENGGGNDWDFSYRLAYYANLVLEWISSGENTGEVANLKGQALFWRAKSFFQNVLLWSPAYDATTASTDMGIPLRLSSDFNETSVRPSVEETYQQIIKDLKESGELLPNQPLHVLRPSKAAAYGMLARVYLSMHAYDSSLKYADMCLAINNSLMDYNGDPEIDPNANFPFKRFNREVIFCTAILTPESLYMGLVDTSLYNSYADADLRKTYFFNGPSIQSFKGNYEGANLDFSGIATDEVYLMRAECYARLNNVAAALQDLNDLMVKRISTGSFNPYATTDAETALAWILAERRKELVFRGIRWMDVKRLNKEGRNIVLERRINNQQYLLPPNDARYALPIPDDIIELSDMPQNER